jgi:hypothetical protein
MFGLGKSNKKRTNRRSRRTSKRRSSRRQRGGNADLASAYGAAPAAGGDAKEQFAGMLPEAFANHGAAKEPEHTKAVAGAPPAGAPPAAAAPQKGGAGAGAPPAKGGRRRRGSKGRKSFGTGEMTAAALTLANFYGPGAKSRRNRRKSRRNRSQRRR